MKKSTRLLPVGLLFALVLMGTQGACLSKPSEDAANRAGREVMEEKNGGMERAYFAGGCFWCVESDFEQLDGVSEVISGYAGGRVENPSYHEVSSGRTGHLEAVEVVYDPKKASYEELLRQFFRHVDPTDPGGQFVDRGNQYRTAVFVRNDEERKAVKKVIAELDANGPFGKPIVTDVLNLDRFFVAEDYHQNYYRTHPVRYKYYRWNSGRDQFIEKTWGKEPDEK